MTIKNHIPQYFKTNDFSNQLAHRGVHSDDPEKRGALLLDQGINNAINGSTQALNGLLTEVKNGYLHEADYQKIKKIYKGESEEEVLSTGKTVKVK